VILTSVRMSGTHRWYRYILYQRISDFGTTHGVMETILLPNCVLVSWMTAALVNHERSPNRWRDPVRIRPNPRFVLLTDTCDRSTMDHQGRAS